ncbi:MAG: DUF3320 domain-containing protein, partial [Asticcacaulis sp.]
LENDIAAALRNLGHEVRTRIGVSGFRVDVAVADPKHPGRFLLGIECDAGQYRDARTARDRDRLRRQVLEAHGWSIHRVWSADWYLRPKEELRRITAAIVAAGKLEGTETGAFVAPPSSVAAAVSGGISGLSSGTRPAAGPLHYREADFRVSGADPERLSIADLAGYVTQIVAIEGPVHVDEVAARLRTVFGLARVTPRLKNFVSVALRAAEGRGHVSATGDFYGVAGQSLVVRDRSRVLSQGLKKPDMLPPQEVDHAIVTVIGENFGAPRSELIQAVARRFGFALTGAALKDRIDGRIDFLLQCNILTIRDGLITRGDAA